ncbi:MAG: cytochrome c [Polyangiaceae bacterium]
MRSAPTNALVVARAADWWLGAVLLAACGGAKEPGEGTELTPIAECKVQAPTACPDPATRYADVVDIFRSKCVSCHYGAAGGPWPLTTYEDASDWKDTIRDDLLDCSMPPPDAGVELSDQDRRAILTWVRCGAGQ